jgi:ribonuclease HI
MTEIYIQTSTKDIRIRKQVKAKYQLCASVNGQQMTRDGIVLLNNATSKAAALAALTEALQRFQKPAVIKIYISDDYVRNMLTMQMPARWERNGWHKIRYNGELKYAPYWKRIKELLSAHAVRYASADEIKDNKILKEMDWRMNHVRS